METYPGNIENHKTMDVPKYTTTTENQYDELVGLLGPRRQK